MAGNDRAKKLKRLFRDTGQAHHQAFTETDGEWPVFNARYMARVYG